MQSFAPYLIALGLGLPGAWFGYLRYRAYTDLVRHVVDKEGAKGLLALSNVAGPWRPLSLSRQGKQLSRQHRMMLGRPGSVERYRVIRSHCPSSTNITHGRVLAQEECGTAPTGPGRGSPGWPKFAGEAAD
jgi:hypothetical protein